MFNIYKVLYKTENWSKEQNILLRIENPYFLLYTHSNMPKLQNDSCYMSSYNNIKQLAIFFD